MHLGKQTIWMVEGGTPNTLIRNGITRKTLVPGTVIVVRGYQSKGRLCLPRCIANGRDVTFPVMLMGALGSNSAVNAWWALA